MSTARSLVVVCGLAAEAKIAAGQGSMVIAGGGDIARLTSDLQNASRYAAGILSFGVAGGLAPMLRPGDVCVADTIIGPDDERFETNRAWTEAVAAKLQARRVPVAGVHVPLADVSGKAALHRRTGAASVDMESHIVARVAALGGIPFAAIRVITDPADRALPHAATVGMRADGSIDLPAILASLAKKPGQLPGLVRTGLDARLAFAALLRCRQLLGPRFALLDL